MYKRQGFYIQALLYDIDFTENDGKTAIREELERLAAEKGPHFLHQMLEEIDPASAEAIHENNIKRVIRAIEFYRQTGGPISLHNQTEREKELSLIHISQGRPTSASATAFSPAWAPPTTWPPARAPSWWR